jgi:hypothetical protein
VPQSRMCGIAVSVLAMKEYEMGNWEMVSCRKRLIRKMAR